MTDEIDQAQAVEELALMGSIKRARGEQLRRDAVEPNCTGCGEPIDEDRRRANPKATRCLECQHGVESGRRMFMRKLL